MSVLAERTRSIGDVRHVTARPLRRLSGGANVNNHPRTSHVTIYALTDSDDQIRYVGRTAIGPERRFKRHLEDARYGRQIPACDWIRSCNFAIKITTLQVVLYDDGPAAELAWIRKLRDEGRDLVNLQGFSHRPSAEQRAIISETNRKRFSDPAARARVSEANRGRVMSEDTRERLRLANTGRVPDDLIRERMSAASRGTAKTPEHRAKITVALRRRGMEMRGKPQKRVSPENVREIRRLYASGQYVQRELAVRFGISGPAVSNIVTGRTYSGVA